MKAYTDINQSKKLAEILPIDTADGFYEAQHNPTIDDWEYVLFTGNEWASPEVVVPAWSLAALFELLPYPILSRTDVDNFCCKIFKGSIVVSSSGKNSIDACVEMILKLKEEKIL